MIWAIYSERPKLGAGIHQRYAESRLVRCHGLDRKARIQQGYTYMDAWHGLTYRNVCQRLMQDLCTVHECSLTLTVEDFPRGFPKLARFLDSDDNFMVYRRFGTVCSRLLLHKQDEISKMEGVLHNMDKMDERAKNEKYLMSRSLDIERDGGVPECWPESRPQLMEKLEKKFVEYG